MCSKPQSSQRSMTVNRLQKQFHVAIEFDRHLKQLNFNVSYICILNSDAIIHRNSHEKYFWITFRVFLIKNKSKNVFFLCLDGKFFRFNKKSSWVIHTFKNYKENIFLKFFTRFHQFQMEISNLEWRITGY